MSDDSQPSLFLDTNILVYAFDRSAGMKHVVAAQLVKDRWEDEAGCLSIQVLQEFVVTVTQKIANPLTHQAVQQIVSDLGQWQVHSPGVNDLLQALDLQDRYPLSFWDAMIVQSALRMKCKQLLSEDLNAAQFYGSVQVINPFKE
jgi:predicted nucleic acid-binding protein